MSSTFPLPATVYNMAIARSNRELVINAVIILFVTEIDEQMFLLVEAMFPSWLDVLRADSKNQSDEEQEAINHRDGHIEQTNEEKTDKGEQKNKETTIDEC
jgi:hypothetical protein